MSIVKEIETAIHAHSSWKLNFTTSIFNGHFHGMTPDSVSDSSEGPFGEWLYRKVDAQYRQGLLYTEIVKTHELCHKEAGIILQMVLDGNKVDATQRMISDGDFIHLSDQLISLLRDWQLEFNEIKKH